MVYQNSKDWKSSQFCYSGSVLEMIKCLENNIISAGPGAGKTEFLAQKACFILETGLCKYPYNILAITYKNDASRNIKSRVKERCPVGMSNNFTAMTFHGFCKQILDQFREVLPEDLKPTHDYIIKSLSYREWNEITRGKSLNAFSFQLGIILGLEGQEKIELDNFWQKQLFLMNDKKSHLTFDMMVALAIYILHDNDDIANIIRQKYPYVFVDEFQDTTAVQYHLLISLFQGYNNIITAVGDPKQKIMEWAGAKKYVNQHFSDEFKAKKLSLKTNYRSNAKIVDLINTVTEYIHGDTDDGDKNSVSLSLMDKVADRVGNDQSVIIKKDFPCLNSQYNAISQEIRYLIQNQDLQPHEILIIRRQKIDEIEDFFTNLGNNISVFNSNKSFGTLSVQDLQDDPCSQFLMSILLLMHDVDIEYINAWNVFYDTMGTLRGINEERNTNDFFAECDQIIKNIKDENISYNPNEIAIILNNPIFIEYVKEFKQNYALFGYNSQDGILSAQQSFEEYITFLADRENNWHSVINQYHGINCVHLMTIHKAKGLEYDTVFFVDVDEKTFWSDDAVGTQFFVACSRAKERVRIYASNPELNAPITKILDHLIGT